MDEEKVEESGQRRKEALIPLTEALLGKMLDQNVKYFDSHYIQERSQEIIEKTILKLKFNSEDVQKAKRAFLDVLIDGARKHTYSFKDDEKAAKAALDVFRKKKESKQTLMKDDINEKDAAKAVLEKLERFSSNNPKDKTEERAVNCEKVCQFIVKSIFDKKLILKDEEVVNDAIELDNQLSLSIPAMAHFQELIDQLYHSLDESYMRANEVNWGCPRHEIRLSQIDQRLKK